jgi:hypothetical protein
MPLSGGGMEIAFDLLGKGIFTIHPSLKSEEITKTLRQALVHDCGYSFDKTYFSPKHIASQYLQCSMRNE